MANIVLRFLIGVGLAAFISLLCVIYYYNEVYEPDPFSVARGGTWQQVSTALSERLAQKFPIGTRKADVIAGLLQEGFRPHEPSSTFPLGMVTGYKYSYEAKKSRFPCLETWGVYFDADNYNLITRIVGQIGGTCL